MLLKDKVLESYDKNKAVELLKMIIETPSVTWDETELAMKLSEFMLQNDFDEVKLQEVDEGKYQTIGTVKAPVAAVQNVCMFPTHFSNIKIYNITIFIISQHVCSTNKGSHSQL